LIKALIEFCASNVATFAPAIVETLENDPDLDVDVLEYGCLGNCGECGLQPYALVNGKLVQAEDADELLEKIKKALKEEELAEGRRTG